MWAHFDLPSDDPRTSELSGAAWDPKERVLWCVQDKAPRIVGLVPDAELRSWTIGESIELQCGGGPTDLEGIVVVPDGFIVSNEEGPHIVHVDRRGRFVREIVVPARFGDIRHNLSFESLSLDPSGRYLFTTTEAALKRDGGEPTQKAGSRVRFLRLDLRSGALSEHAYETDPLLYPVGDWGISELAALGESRLLVLERGWSEGHGNTVRIYETALDEHASCTSVERLSAGTPVMAKTLRIDLAQLGTADFPPAKQPQASPLLDNYEGMSLGPPLPDGRPSLLLVSDDNGHANQLARILVLAL